MPYDISVKPVPGQVALTRRLVVAHRDLGSTLGATFEATYGHLARRGLQPAGPPFVIFHERLNDGERWDLEICAPFVGDAVRVGEPPPGSAVRPFPAEEVVTTLHRGPYEEVGPAYGALSAWAAEHGYKLAGPPRECYLSEPSAPPQDTETVIEWPVTRVRMPAAV